MPTLSDTMTSSSATMCHGGDATSQSNDWNQYGVRIVLQAIGAQQPIRLVQDKVWYDGRTQETFNQ